MTLRLLPNYYKKIGLVLFLLTVWPAFIKGFIRGYNYEELKDSTASAETIKADDFTVFGYPILPDSFIEGYNAEVNEESNDDTARTETFQIEEVGFLGFQIFSDPFVRLFSILSTIGLIIYALSRDKIFDEFLLKLRMEAMHLTFFLSVFIIFTLLLFDIKSEMSALYVVELQALIFLIAKKIKKVRMQPPEAGAYEQ